MDELAIVGDRPMPEIRCYKFPANGDHIFSFCILVSILLQGLTFGDSLS